MSTSLPLQLPVSSLRRNLRRGLIITYLKVEGLGVKSLFNKNIIEPGDNEEYIKEAIDTMAILRAK